MIPTAQGSGGVGHRSSRLNPPWRGAGGRGGGGTRAGRIPAGGKQSDHHPALSQEGAVCIYASEVVANACTIAAWNRVTEKDIDLSAVNQSPNTLMAPSLAVGARDIYLYDDRPQVLVPTPELNSAQDEYNPVLVVSSEE